jgi:aspartate racemase
MVHADTPTLLANQESGDVEVVAPPNDLMDEIHKNDIAVAQTGLCSPEQRSFFFEAGARMIADNGLDAILLAGTDLALVFSGPNPGFPILDCAHVHALAIAAAAREPDRSTQRLNS